MINTQIFSGNRYTSWEIEISEDDANIYIGPGNLIYQDTEYSVNAYIYQVPAENKCVYFKLFINPSFSTVEIKCYECSLNSTFIPPSSDYEMEFIGIFGILRLNIDTNERVLNISQYVNSEIISQNVSKDIDSKITRHPINKVNDEPTVADSISKYYKKYWADKALNERRQSPYKLNEITDEQKMELLTLLLRSHGLVEVD
jgi:hypothetical protein